MLQRQLLLEALLREGHGEGHGEERAETRRGGAVKEERAGEEEEGPSSELSPSKMSVVKLRSELTRIGLPADGRKGALVARLTQHLLQDAPPPHQPYPTEEEEGPNHLGGRTLRVIFREWNAQRHLAREAAIAIGRSPAACSARAALHALAASDAAARLGAAEELRALAARVRTPGGDAREIFAGAERRAGPLVGEGAEAATGGGEEASLSHPILPVCHTPCVPSMRAMLHVLLFCAADPSDCRRARAPRGGDPWQEGRGAAPAYQGQGACF